MGEISLTGLWFFLKRLERKRDLELFASWGNLNSFQLDETEDVKKGMKGVQDKIFNSISTTKQSKLLLTSFMNKFLEEMERGLSLSEFKVKNEEKSSKLSGFGLNRKSKRKFQRFTT